MGRLLSLQTALQRNSVAVIRLEEALAHDPHSHALNLMGRSLRNQGEQLHAEFLAEAKRSDTAVCSYRLFSLTSERYTVSGVSAALQDFQNLFTVVYDALKGRPKARAMISSEIKEETEFSWAYTFPGSLGVVLTLPHQRQLFETNPYFDRAMQTVFEMVQSRTAPDVLKYSRIVGSASVRQMDKWANDHADAGLGADIQWTTQSTKPIARLFIQVPEIHNLRNAISLSSETDRREVVIGARLVGVDLDRKSFHLKTDTKQDIRGYFADAITDEHTAQVPADYLAKVRVTTRTVYSTEQDEDDYFLISLETRKQ